MAYNILIIGNSDGIGAAVTQALLREGHHVDYEEVKIGVQVDVDLGGTLDGRERVDIDQHRLDVDVHELGRRSRVDRGCESTILTGNHVERNVDKAHGRTLIGLNG